MVGTSNLGSWNGHWLNQQKEAIDHGNTEGWTMGICNVIVFTDLIWYKSHIYYYSTIQFKKTSEEFSTFAGKHVANLRSSGPPTLHPQKVATPCSRKHWNDNSSTSDTNNNNKYNTIQ
jgi:hypothetical protein